MSKKKFRFSLGIPASRYCSSYVKANSYSRDLTSTSELRTREMNSSALKMIETALSFDGFRKLDEIFLKVKRACVERLKRAKSFRNEAQGNKNPSVEEATENTHPANIHFEVEWCLW